ncbi:ribonuclease E/G-like protein, chloroplastic [Lycium barbarum]|uniref:ribonuclease E/G-like protein, chloroplastic n=1 Tax=Lycium barbarum TaxID=112863 RepID=UPI00293E7970|nr:ribonuclease E/G-like protein, chloroplastic [Lycium barbarum]XP_060192106.1 ribonuclease E/G-like protein, chloroplastic [Lycium barbarum]
MVILLSCTELSSLWETSKILHSGNLNCNSSMKGDMLTSSTPLCKARHDVSVLVPSKQRGKVFSRNLWIKSCTRMPLGSIFGSSIVERSIPIRLFIPARTRDGNVTVKCLNNNSSILKQVFSDFIDEDSYFSDEIDTASEYAKSISTERLTIEEPWLCESSLLLHHLAESDASSDAICEDKIAEDLDSENVESGFLNQSTLGEDLWSKYAVNAKDPSSGTLCARYAYVEEPWLLQACTSSPSFDAQMAPDGCEVEQPDIKDEAQPSFSDQLEQLAQPLSSDQHEEIPEKLLAVDQCEAISKEDSFTTIILINSSVCTVQRIAVLENEKLVELLLEPVKNNVQCDSVYLGVVTKLAPHMGGAFVNIGTSRPSFMDIKPNREPFIFPPFCREKIINGAAVDMLEENLGLPRNKSTLEEVDTDEIDDADIEDESIEYMDNEFGEHESGDISEVLAENYNGSVTEHGLETHADKYLEESSGIGYQGQNPTIEHAVNGNKVSQRDESKWVQVRKGTKIIVQVVKEGLGTKGPTLTAYPKLRSRFWVLAPRDNMIGISKKIAGVERTRLRVIAKTLQPQGYGLTVRTVAAGHPLNELQKDLEGLLSTWKSITEHAKSAALAADEGVDGAVPVMLHQAMGQTLSVVQDYFSDKVKSLVVDSPRTYHEVTNYLQEMAPNLCERVELYSKRTPLFDEYKIEEEINNILSKRVPLDNGGYLVIEQTEALVSIDVNGGHCVLGQGTSQEIAILNVNLSAARQIAREIRLRDIGGIIVVDFIDMLDDSNKRLVYEEVKKAVERDRSTVKVSELSRHGLMEITRKRVRPSVTFMISEPCTCCHGTGRVEALATAYSKIEREICRLLSTTDQKADPVNPKSWPRFILRVDQFMSNYLTSGKRTRLAILSSSLKVWLLLKVARGFTKGTFELKPLTVDKEYKDEREASISVLRSTEGGFHPPRKKVTIFPIKKWKSSGK